MAKGLHVRISDEAHAAWMRFCREQGVTLTALLEVAGRHGLDSLFDPVELRSVLDEARQLAHERRAAGGPRPSRD